MFGSALLLASFAASVSAHATFQQLWVNSCDQGSYCVRLPQNNNPITSVSTSDIACNTNASPSSGLCQIQPGDSVTVEMHQQPGQRSCANQAIGGDHYGPINIYLAQVSDATTAVGSSASWFKISEIGLPSSNPDYWGTEVLNDNCGHYTFTIPDIAPGQYLLRAEVIALHVASTAGGAQFYVSCYQLNVGGSGTASPATVKFPGAYSAQDPGILINIYTQLNSYAIPGPAPYGTTSPAVATTAWPSAATWATAGQPATVPAAPVCTESGGPAPPQKSTSTPVSKPSTTPPTSPTTNTTPVSKPTTTTPVSKPTTTSTGSGAALYGQCGGEGYTGPTSCAQGTCTYSNPYYSQCLPS